MRALVLLSLLSAGCATLSPARRGPTCTSFVTFDAEVRAAVAELATKPPSNASAVERSDLLSARRQCARHVLEGLPALRAQRGLEAVRPEVAALDATFKGNELRILVLDAARDASAINELLLELGSPGGYREPPQRVAAPTAPEPPSPPPPAGPRRVCDVMDGCARLECAVTHAEDEVDAAAATCLSFARTLEPTAQAANLAEALRLLGERGGPARLELEAALRELQPRQWVWVEQASAAGQHARAAQLAEPFTVLAPAKVEQLRSRARVHHRQRAAELSGTPDAAWLHLALAAEFGDPPPPKLGGSGTWTRAATCDEPLPELRPLPPGVQMTLTLRCQRDDQRPPEERWGAPRWPYEGFLTVACANWQQNYAVHARTREFELENVLAKQTKQALRDCVGRFNVAEEAWCAELPKLDEVRALAQALGFARFTHRWVKCFREWLKVHEGLLEAPEPPPSFLDSLDGPDAVDE